MLRISDEDRHAVAEVLRHAAGEGRIDLDELDDRLEATYAAKTYGDLVPITHDLPVSGRPAPTPAPPAGAPEPVVVAARHAASVSVMSDCKRRGVWEMPERHTAVAFMGSITLDLREARLAAREVTIDACAIMGSIDVVVNAHTQVVLDGFGLMGEFSEQRPKVDPALDGGSPVVRVRGLALMGSVHVQRKGPARPPFLRRGTASG